MKKNFLAGIATVLCAALLAPYAQAQFGNQPSKLSLIKVRDDIYVIHNEFVPGNVTALITNEGVLLVDNKFEIDHENIMAQLRTVTNQPVKYVINTHYHGDHSGGNAKLQGLGAHVIASENARVKMVEGRQPGLPSVTVAEQLNIYLGGKRVEVYRFGRAHTDGDVFVYFPEQKVLAAGDAFTVGNTTPQLIDYSGGGSARDWTGTLDAALKLDFDTVVPGHGVVANKEELRKFRDSTAALRDRVRQMLAEKKSRQEIEQMLRRDFHWADLHVNRGLDGLLVELR